MSVNKVKRPVYVALTVDQILEEMRVFMVKNDYKLRDMQSWACGRVHGLSEIRTNTIVAYRPSVMLKEINNTMKALDKLYEEVTNDDNRKYN